MSTDATLPTEAGLRPRRATTSPLGFGSPRLADYMGLWAIKKEFGEGLAEKASRVNLRLHVLAQEAAAEAEADVAPPKPKAAGRFGDGYGENLTEDGTAIIRVEGTLMKFASSLSRGTGTVALRQMVRRARNDAGVQRVFVIVDSPGGTVAGTQELAQDLADLAAAKPTHVFVDSLMASAALWIGVQGAVVSASPTSLVGSVGTYMAVADYSAMARKEGIKVHVITNDEAPEHKGAGTPGTKVTASQLAEWRRIVNGLNGHFLDGISSGRRLPLAKVKELADGRIHLAAEAKALGLIDHVETQDAAWARLMKASGGKPAARVPRAEEGAAGGLQANSDAGGRSAGATQPTAEDAGTPAGAAADRKEETAMSQTQTAPAPTAGASTEQQPAKPQAAASMAELKAACPGATSDFLVEQAEKGATVAQAKDAYLAFQSTEITRLKAELKTAGEASAQAKSEAKPAEAKSEPKAEGKKGAGVAPLADRAAEHKSAADEAGSDAVAVFDQRVKALTDKGMSRTKAAAKVLADDDQLRADYVAAKAGK